jgi:glycosyltransferase involved in cell wall biosynthesis
MPRVSVVMPVRNSLRFLDESIRSVLDQSLDDLELVAVDDGSSDGSLEKLRAWESSDERVRVRESPSRGIVAALNLGVASARADLVARMDADDACHRLRLELQVQRLEREAGLDVVGCAAGVISDEPTPGLEAYLGWVATLTDPRRVWLGCLVESPLVHSGVLARHDVLATHPYRTAEGARLAEGIPPHDGSTWPEDYDLWLRLLRAGARIANLPETLVRVRWHRGKATRTGGFTIGSMARLKLDHLLRTALADRPAVVIQGAGRHGKMWLRMLRAAGVEVRALLDVARGRQGRRIEGVMVHPVQELEAIERRLVLVAVGQKGPNTRRDEVRGQLGPMGLEEGKDYVFVC